MVEADRWETLDVMLGLHQRPAAGRLVLSIYANGVDGKPLRRVSKDLAEATDNGPFRFPFPAITNSGQRRMLLRFHLENPSHDTRVSLYEQGSPLRSLVGRALRVLSSKGGPLFCRMGFRDAIAEQ